MALITLSEAKNALGITATDQDTQIAALLGPVSGFVESYAGRTFSSDTVTEYFEGGTQHLLLRRFPVSSVSSVVDRVDDSTVDSSEYEIEGDTGFLRALPVGSIWRRYEPSAFRPYAREVQRRWMVTYTGGPSAAPEDVKLAVIDILGQMIQAQGGVESISDGDFSVSFAEAQRGITATAARVLERYRASPI